MSVYLQISIVLFAIHVAGSRNKTFVGNRQFVFIPKAIPNGQFQKIQARLRVRRAVQDMQFPEILKK